MYIYIYIYIYIYMYIYIYIYIRWHWNCIKKRYLANALDNLGGKEMMITSLANSFAFSLCLIL